MFMIHPDRHKPVRRLQLYCSDDIRTCRIRGDAAPIFAFLFWSWKKHAFINRSAPSSGSVATSTESPSPGRSADCIWPELLGYWKVRGTPPCIMSKISMSSFRTRPVESQEFLGYRRFPHLRHPTFHQLIFIDVKTKKSVIEGSGQLLSSYIITLCSLSLLQKRTPVLLIFQYLILTTCISI